MVPSSVVELACLGVEPTHAIDSTSQGSPGLPAACVPGRRRKLLIVVWPPGGPACEPFAGSQPHASIARISDHITENQAASACRSRSASACLKAALKASIVEPFDFLLNTTWTIAPATLNR